MNVCKEASNINKQINKLIEKYPIEQNETKWRCLIKTIKRDVGVIEEKYKDIISRQTRKLASLKSKKEPDEYLN